MYVPLIYSYIQQQNNTCPCLIAWIFCQTRNLPQIILFRDLYRRCVEHWPETKRLPRPKIWFIAVGYVSDLCIYIFFAVSYKNKITLDCSIANTHCTCFWVLILGQRSGAIYKFDKNCISNGTGPWYTSNGIFPHWPDYFLLLSL